MTEDKIIEFANKTLERWVAEDGYIYYKANLQGLEAFAKLVAAQEREAQDKLNDDDALTIAYQSGFYDGKKAAQPAQEHVAWMYNDDNELVPLFTAPPPRPWVGLTEENFSAINQSCFTKLQAATSAESILKAKNT